jgi:hypothetical protein
MIPLLGFTPDAEAPAPGTLVDCSQFIPYATGMMAAPSPVAPSDVPPLAAECRHAAVVTLLDGTRRVIAGTAAKLYEAAGGSWSDRSRAGNYTGGADSRWSLAQFGNATLAANRADVIQRSTGASFADIATAPKAEVLFSVGPQVMALNVNDGAEKTDGWHCCALFDDTDWTPSLTTQAASGRLVATPGALTAGGRLGEYAVAYKAQSIYLGQYVGSPAVWDWILVPGGNAGCVGKEALCEVDGLHFFVGADSFWMFDGTRPVQLGDKQVRQWFYDNSEPSSLYKTKCVHDRLQNRVWIFYPSRGSLVVDSALVYHLKSQQWGRADRRVQAVLNYIGSGVTIDGLAAVASTYDALPEISYDSQYWLAGGTALSFFNEANQLQSLSGPAMPCSLTTGDAGDDDGVTLLKRIRLRFAAGFAPATATVQTFSKMNAGDGLTAGSAGSLNDGKFDVLQSARWHRARVDMTGNVRVTALNAVLEAAGQR